MSFTKKLFFNSGYQITQEFGGNSEMYAKFGLKGHSGIDLIPGDNSFGAIFYSPVKGEVIKKGYDQYGYGHWVMVWSKEEKICIRACHFAQASSLNIGDNIEFCEDLGIMGNSGNSFGEHVHFEIIPVDDNCLKLYPNNGYYGAVERDGYFEKWQNKLDKLNNPKLETKPTQIQENLPPKMTTKQGLQELLRYYPEFTADVENGWPIARFDIDGAGEGLKMVAEQVLQPMYNRNTNLQAQLQSLKSSQNSSDVLPVKKNESQSQENPNPRQAEIKSDQVYLGTDSVEVAEVKTNIIEGQADVIQFQKNQEIKELITNPYVVKAETPLWKSKTILTNLGGFGTVISLLSAINIPSIKASLDQVVGTDYCNYLILVIVILVITNVLSILYKITDKKVLNQDNLLKLISFGQTTLATSQDLINQGKDLAEQANKIQTTFYNIKK